MGTRHFVGVIENRNWRIAQYGQWDGYPDVQGVCVLDALSLDGVQQLKEKLKYCRFLTSLEIEEVSKYSEEYLKAHPALNRDTGAGILSLVQEAVSEIELVDNHDFLSSTMCEFAYIIDYDAFVLQCFSHNKQWAEYSLDALPSNQEFLQYYEDWVSKEYEDIL